MPELDSYSKVVVCRAPEEIFSDARHMISGSSADRDTLRVRLGLGGDPTDRTHQQVCLVGPSSVDHADLVPAARQLPDGVLGQRVWRTLAGSVHGVQPLTSSRLNDPLTVQAAEANRARILVRTQVPNDLTGHGRLRADMCSSDQRGRITGADSRSVSGSTRHQAANDSYSCECTHREAFHFVSSRGRKNMPFGMFDYNNNTIYKILQAIRRCRLS